MATASSAPSKAEESKDASAASLLNVIPTVYYDLIARICPGMGFWVALSFVSTEFAKLISFRALSGSDLFVLIVLSYLSGIVFTVSPFTPNELAPSAA
jgi:hypothetical protein